jgi:hypothetical protein
MEILQSCLRGDNKAVGSKDFIKKFGKTTEWTYGCIPGQNEIYIYNWMISNEDGIHYFLSLGVY